MDGSRPGNPTPVTGKDLRLASTMCSRVNPASANQQPASAVISSGSPATNLVIDGTLAMHSFLVIALIAISLGQTDEPYYHAEQIFTPVECKPMHRELSMLEWRLDRLVVRRCSSGRFRSIRCSKTAGEAAWSTAVCDGGSARFPDCNTAMTSTTVVVSGSIWPTILAVHGNRRYSITRSPRIMEPWPHPMGSQRIICSSRPTSARTLDIIGIT